MSITVISPGPLTTVQDAGRTGYMQYGIGTCGAMDQEAYRAGNALVGNAGGEAMLEATLMGPTLRFDDECLFALTGADMGALLDGAPAPRYRAVRAQAGQVLEVGFARAGCRGYIAVQGGIDVPKVMGSRSTDLKCRAGGVEGRALRRGDVLKAGAAVRPAEGRAMPAPDYANDITVRVVPGPQYDCFTDAGHAAFLSMPYTLTQDSDRMGMRLDGAPIESVKGVDIVSDGTMFGSIQVPRSGKPIILMADHQTTGGYAKIATVCSQDLPLLAQLRPGGTVRFIAVSVDEAQRAYRRGIASRMRGWLGAR